VTGKIESLTQSDRNPQAMSRPRIQRLTVTGRIPPVKEVQPGTGILPDTDIAPVPDAAISWLKFSGAFDRQAEGRDFQTA
jgi:hypothetical protein